ncbi:nucleotidyltransferase domain-containing protein [Nitratiruptor tergarcus]|uniref:Nucleotidyltransferase domain-containing protein n=1 Tax=Nitratiruptor tergarcus DSM 16512 TaxID=1069081 RepID=A0A1W1WTG1_9BACT|nr:nucleotidyltransferase domain-containing protein [Nitratiruptor tergarcus]SMC09492.1 Nucleotidyltransferase domain-containing protein [Nitratiruptor tergarcus DSM 16512]
MSKIDIEKLKNEIVERLKPLEPDKIILFGSYAYGKSNEESDIDLYIVTKDDYIPQNVNEKMDLKFRYFKPLENIAKDFGLDFIVHTKPMHQKFIENNSSFAKEIQKGIVLWLRK